MCNLFILSLELLSKYPVLRCCKNPPLKGRMLAAAEERAGIIGHMRIALHHLCVDELITLFEDPDDLSIYEGKGFDNPHRVLMDDSGPLRWRVPQVLADPTVNIWLVRWIVLPSTEGIIGSISFHGPPDTAGMIEIGLGIHPKFQRQGYGREALAAMWSWAIDQPKVETLRYTVSPTNVASVKLVESFEFTRVGEQMDEIDGPEDIYEMSADDFRAR